MNLISLIFHLGVFFAIFGFIWGIFDFGIKILTGQRRTVVDEYLSKGLKYLLLVNVTYLFCQDQQMQLDFKQYLLTGAILFMYFMGKLQKEQTRINLFQGIGRELPNSASSNFNLKLEIGVISLALVSFVLYFFYPQYTQLGISNWFHSTILDIEDTPIIGAVFQFIGFFFLLGILLKLINGIFYLLSGKPIVQLSSGFRRFNSKDNKEDFDDFEEL